MLSTRAQNLKTSPTLFLVAKAKELQAQGHDVISLTVGEPDWPTYKCASEAGIEAIQKNITKYTPANGTMELRKQIAMMFKEEIGITYPPSAVCVGPGAKFVIFAALQMICNPGDEVILSAPYWVSYPTMIELADGKPVIIETGEKENFKITPAALERAITPKTKGFLFCSPSNPTGLMYTKEELKALADVLKKHPQIVIISDDMYNKLTFDGSKMAPHILHVAPELADRTVVVNGGSKAYSMTGWRIGWAAGPEKLLKAMGDYQSQSTGAPSSIAQHAVLAALKGGDADIEATVKMLKHRREMVLNQFKKLPHMKVSPPDGAFYLWVDIKYYLGKKYAGQVIENDKVFADILLNKFFVATVPGTESGTNGYLRLSFAAAEDRIKEAIVRMVKFTSEIQ
jgi:aspartate aminotransferase